MGVDLNVRIVLWPKPKTLRISDSIIHFNFKLCSKAVVRDVNSVTSNNMSMLLKSFEVHTLVAPNALNMGKIGAFWPKASEDLSP